MKFYAVDPSLENHWRAIILFGRNVASYKFALAKSLYELSNSSHDLVKLDELAEPFSRHLCQHLLHTPKQTTSKSSKFIDSCVLFNRGELSQDALLASTAKLGFKNVIDAFHIVNSEEIEKRFFIDERQNSGGIRLTEDFFRLANCQQFESFNEETEARWRLVEQGWRMGLSRSLISVEYDRDQKILFTTDKDSRVDITSCRSSLNGYQKGHCFYCYTPISIEKNSALLADVDHFFPWKLKNKIRNINGLWNLVLACGNCNRGEGGKFVKIPHVSLLERLHKRNEYLINSHLPMRETLIQQTGYNEKQRRSFLQNQHTTAVNLMIQTWKPKSRGNTIF